MAVERYGSKTDVVVKLVLVFFIALLSFSIGTFVGKKFSDNQHKLTQLEPHSNTETAGPSDGHQDGHGESRGVASISPEAHEAKPSDRPLTDDEIAKLAEEFVTDDEKPAAHGGTAAAQADHSDSHAAPAKKEVHAPSAGHGDSQSAAPAPAPTSAPVAAAKPAAAPLAPAVRMAEGKSPVVENPVRPTSRIPSALPKEVASSAIGKFTVQVAAYTSEKEAQTMAADLKSKGFSAFYVTANVKGTTYYRVSVGLFTTMKEADTYKSDLMNRAKVSSAIVQKITSAE